MTSQKMGMSAPPFHPPTPRAERTACAGEIPGTSKDAGFRNGPLAWWEGPTRVGAGGKGHMDPRPALPQHWVLESGS